MSQSATANLREKIDETDYNTYTTWKSRTANKRDYQQTPFQNLSDFFEAASFLRTISSTQSLYI
jgi:hypothetical protein